MTLAGTYSFSGNACSGNPVFSSYFFANPEATCTQYATGTYFKVNCSATPPEIGLSLSNTCAGPVAIAYNTSCIAQSGISYINTCRQVDVSTIVTTRFYTNSACAGGVLQAAIVEVNSCNLATYSTFGANKIAKLAIAADGNITSSVFSTPCTGTAESTTTVVTGACVPLGTFLVNNANVTVYMKAQPGVPWYPPQNQGNSTTPTTRSPSGGASSAVASVAVVVGLVHAAAVALFFF